MLRAFSAADGKMLAELKLDAPPVFDGLIAARAAQRAASQSRAAGRLFLCTTDGHVVCLGKGK